MADEIKPTAHALAYDPNDPDAASVSAHIIRSHLIDGDTKRSQVVDVYHDHVQAASEALEGQQDLSLQQAMDLVESKVHGKPVAQYKEWPQATPEPEPQRLAKEKPAAEQFDFDCYSYTKDSTLALPDFKMCFDTGESKSACFKLIEVPFFNEGILAQTTIWGYTETIMPSPTGRGHLSVKAGKDKSFDFVELYLDALTKYDPDTKSNGAFYLTDSACALFDIDKLDPVQDG